MLASRLNLGAILIEYLDYQRANEQFSQALKIEPDHCVANLGYGATQYALQAYPEAVKHYQFYVSKCDEKHVSSYERLAKLHEGPLADPAKAIEYYQALLTLGPGSDQEKQYKAMINFLESQKNQQKPKTPETTEQPSNDGGDGQDGMKEVLEEELPES